MNEVQKKLLRKLLEKHKRNICLQTERDLTTVQRTTQTSPTWQVSLLSYSQNSGQLVGCSTKLTTSKWQASDSRGH